MSGVCFTKDTMEEMYDAYLKTRENTDIVWFLHQNLFRQGVRCLSVMNTDEMKEQAQLWRQMKRDGQLQMISHNNKTKTIKREKYYMLVVQSKNDDDNIDPAGLMIAGEMVSGCCYFFRSEKNRDAIFKYVNTPPQKKGKKKQSKKAKLEIEDEQKDYYKVIIGSDDDGDREIDTEEFYTEEAARKCAEARLGAKWAQDFDYIKIEHCCDDAVKTIDEIRIREPKIDTGVNDATPEEKTGILSYLKSLIVSNDIEDAD